MIPLDICDYRWGCPRFRLLRGAADGQAYSYCVEGTALTMTPVSTGLTGTVSGAFVLRRQ